MLTNFLDNEQITFDLNKKKQDVKSVAILYSIFTTPESF